MRSLTFRSGGNNANLWRETPKISLSLYRLYSFHSFLHFHFKLGFLFSSQISHLTSTPMQMENSVTIDLENTPPPPPLQDPSPNRPKSNPRKRKKELNSVLQNLRSPEEKQSHIETLEKELEGLFEYYRVVLSKKVAVDLKQCGGSRNAVVAALMEESELPLSKLVDEIHGKLNSELANGGIVLAESFNSALVKSSVLFIGQRMMYGVPNADADILEDHSDSCLWCWEVIIRFLFVWFDLCYYILLTIA